MALTKGQRLAIYLLLNSDSVLRRGLEGRSGPVSGAGNTTPPADSDDLITRFAAHESQLGLDPADRPANLASLFTPNHALSRNNVSTDPGVILTALDGNYIPDDSACPDGGDQAFVVKALRDLP
ncbi:MAG TPA: hypothetical protein VNV86_01555 [Candidatus Acidoferrum sp.]|jgi:hypothetical protein|nr:hypothetical protein [Candidatus Acidoferrum sp.]